MSYSDGDFEIDGWHLRFEAILRGVDSADDSEWVYFPQGGPRELVRVRCLDPQTHGYPYWGTKDQLRRMKIPLPWNEYRPWEPLREIEVPDRVRRCAHSMLLHHASYQYLALRGIVPAPAPAMTFTITDS